MKIIEIIDGERQVNYYCERCGYKTRTKHLLISHFKRVNQCLPEIKTVSVNTLLEQYTTANKYQCEVCSRLYKSKDSLKKHVCRIQKGSSQTEDASEIASEVSTEVASEVAMDETLTDSLTKSTDETEPVYPMDGIVKDPENPFIEYINEDFLIEHYLSGPNILPILAKMIYFNKDHPENHVFFIKNIHTSKAYMYRDERWNIVSCSYALNLIFKTIRSLIFVTYTRSLNTYLTKKTEQDSMLIDHEKYLRDEYIIKPRLTGMDLERRERDILKMMDKKRDALNNELDLLNIQSRNLQKLYQSLNHKKEYYYSKYLKQIKEHLIEFNTVTRKSRPVTNQYYISFHRAVEEAAQRRLAQLLRERGLDIGDHSTF